MKTSWEKWFGQTQAKARPIHTYRNVVETAEHCLGALYGKRVLEVGCGRGVTLLEFCKKGAVGTGLDYARNALDIAREYQVHVVDAPKTCWIQGDAEALPFQEGSFDLVYSVGVMEHFRDPAPAITEQHRVLRDGGYLIVQVPQKYSIYTLVKNTLIRLGRWPYGGWETAYSEGELMALAKTGGFALETTYGYGSFFLALLRHLVFHSLDFEGNSSFWHRARLLKWIRTHTALEVGIVARKRLAQIT